MGEAGVGGGVRVGRAWRGLLELNRSDPRPQERAADFNPIMGDGEGFAFEGSQWTFVVKTTRAVRGGGGF